MLANNSPVEVACVTANDRFPPKLTFVALGPKLTFAYVGSFALENPQVGIEIQIVSKIVGCQQC